MKKITLKCTMCYKQVSPSPQCKECKGTGEVEYPLYIIPDVISCSDCGTEVNRKVLNVFSFISVYPSSFNKKSKHVCYECIRKKAPDFIEEYERTKMNETVSKTGCPPDNINYCPGCGSASYFIMLSERLDCSFCGLVCRIEREEKNES
jgi:hypothetical protein